jgi:hypothetical protein
VSQGALAGAVVGILIFLAFVLAAVWYFHKRSKARKLALAEQPPPFKPEVPASAEAVLSRPDPVEKQSTGSQNRVRVFSTHSETTINLDPSQNNGSNDHRASSPGSNIETSPRNPFADDISLQSGSERSQSNIIPIALVPYGQGGQSSTSLPPTRPARSPDDDLRNDSPNPPSSYNLAHVNVSNDNFSNDRNKNFASSVRSNMTGMTGASYLSTGTYATDLFTESPTIVTRQQGRILGVSRAQVVEVPSSLSSNVGDSPLASSHLTPGPRNSRPSARSIRSPLAQNSFTPGDIIEMDEQTEHSPFADSHARKMNPSMRSGVTNDVASVRTVGTYNPWGDDGMSIASGVEASITSAKRVIVSGNSRGVSLGSSVTNDTRAPRFSYASEASSRADSILESFPFVPPSPSHSAHSGSFRTNKAASPAVAEPPSTATGTELDPPKRHILGMSAMSTGTNASSGLESFPFELQITSAADGQPVQQRASLDTLALSRDLAAFPLAYDDRTAARNT